MKFGQNICFLDMRVEFKNGSGQLNNMAAEEGGGSFLIFIHSKNSL